MGSCWYVRRLHAPLHDATSEGYRSAAVTLAARAPEGSEAHAAKTFRSEVGQILLK